MGVAENTILSYLKLASENAGLRDKWINGNDLCLAISIIFNLKENNFTLKELTKELNTKEGKATKIQLEANKNTVHTIMSVYFVKYTGQRRDPPKKTK